jgi:cell division protein FtsB
MRWGLAIVCALLVVVQVDLWFGKGNGPYVLSLQQQLAVQRATNAQAHQRNERLAAELADLKEGLETVEDKARSELGMVKPDELYVQVLPRRP